MAAIDTTDILSAIYSHLTAASAFNTSIGGKATTAGRLWFNKAKPEETLPYAVMSVIDWTADNVFETDGTQLGLQVTVYGAEPDSNPESVAGIVDDLLARMQRASITISNHENTTPHFEIMRGPLYEDEVIRMDVDFTLLIMRS